MNLANLFLDKACQLSSQPAITYERKKTTYKEIADLVQQWRTITKMYIQKGDRVLCMSENRTEIIAIYLAVAGLGGVFIPINPELSQEEISDIIKRTQPVLCITSGKFEFNFPKIHTLKISSEMKQEVDSFERFAEFEPTTPCLICFTSGSTGKAKGVIATHQNEIVSCAQYAKAWHVDSSDKVLVTLPQSFLYGLTTGTLMALLAGAHIFLEKRFHPREVLERIEGEGITVFLGVPTMYTMMLNVQRQAQKNYKTASIRMMLTAGAPIADEILAEFIEVFKTELTNFYALSEIRPIFTHEAGELSVNHHKSCGKCVDGVEVKLIDKNNCEITVPGIEGELIARSETLTTGYYGQPDITQEAIRDGWFYTGDLAKVDEDGYFYITGRIKELVIRGGINISPLEVESFIYNHDAVLETVVVGIPDKTFGEELLAQVIIKPNTTLEEQELRDFLKERLADYKVPKYIEFPDELPKNHSGKINKRLVKEQWQKFELQQLN